MKYIPLVFFLLIVLTGIEGTISDEQHAEFKQMAQTVSPCRLLEVKTDKTFCVQI